MNPNDPTSIPLRDIELPQAVGWWPLAPGWWVLASVLGLAALAGLWVLWRRRRYAAQRFALAELDAIAARFAATRDRHACARELSQLARRLALACGPAQAAAVTGERWLAILEELGGRALTPAQAPVLLSAPYSATAANALDASVYEATFDVMRSWIAATRTTRRRAPVVSGPSAALSASAHD